MSSIGYYITGHGYGHAVRSNLVIRVLMRAAPGLKIYPAFLPLIEKMESFYRKATLALALPYSCNLEIFPARVSIPWIARTSPLNKRRAKAKFGLPDSLPSILLSFGGLGLERLPWEKLKQLREYYFITKISIGRLCPLNSAEMAAKEILALLDQSR